MLSDKIKQDVESDSTQRRDKGRFFQRQWQRASDTEPQGQTTERWAEEEDEIKRNKAFSDYQIKLWGVWVTLKTFPASPEWHAAPCPGAGRSLSHC